MEENKPSVNVSVGDGMIKAITNFIRLESSAGIILFIAAVFAIILANSPWANYYDELLTLKLTISLDDAGLSKPLILWINDGLMAIFFFLVGLEIKREFILGELNSFAKAALPAIAAIGGMVVPALFYIAINYKDPYAVHGWAIPTATDIAFALGVLSLLGSRVPVSLKVFLTALAILDDLGAIVIIAIFYTHELSLLSLALAAVCLFTLFIFNRRGIHRFAPYGLVGIILWVCVLKSGVHATLAGVALAMAYPTQGKRYPNFSPARVIEEALHPWVAFGVLPLFAFANAGLSFSGFTINSLLAPIPLGIALGLIFGKQIGVFLASWIAVKCKIAKLPEGVNWRAIYGLALICGVGFTMSLFIGSLAFTDQEADYSAMVRLGVIVGSFVSGIAGYLILRLSCTSKRQVIS